MKAMNGRKPRKRPREAPKFILEESAGGEGTQLNEIKSCNLEVINLQGRVIRARATAANGEAVQVLTSRGPRPE
jgi:calcineurin-like phosphoesterase